MFLHNTMRYFGILFYFLMGLIISPFVFTMGPVIERELHPVVTSSTITKIVQSVDSDGEDSLSFWGEATKLRDCRYESVEWFSGDPDGEHSRLTMEVKGRPIVSEPGDKFVYGPIKVYINESQLRNNTFAIVYHDCHWGWLSQSTFYP